MTNNSRLGSLSTKPPGISKGDLIIQIRERTEEAHTLGEEAQRYATDFARLNEQISMHQERISTLMKTNNGLEHETQHSRNTIQSNVDQIQALKEDVRVKDDRIVVLERNLDVLLRQRRHQIERLEIENATKDARIKELQTENATKDARIKELHTEIANKDISIEDLTKDLETSKEKHGASNKTSLRGKNRAPPEPDVHFGRSHRR